VLSLALTNQLDLVRACACVCARVCVIMFIYMAAVLRF